MVKINMNTYKIPLDWLQFRHYNIVNNLRHIFTNNEGPQINIPEIKLCVTEKGKDVCECGKYNLQWENEPIQSIDYHHCPLCLEFCECKELYTEQFCVHECGIFNE